MKPFWLREPRDIQLPQEGRRDPKLPPEHPVMGQLKQAAEGWKVLQKRAETLKQLKGK